MAPYAARIRSKWASDCRVAANPVQAQGDDPAADPEQAAALAYALPDQQGPPIWAIAAATRRATVRSMIMPSTVGPRRADQEQLQPTAQLCACVI